MTKLLDSLLMDISEVCMSEMPDEGMKERRGVLLLTHLQQLIWVEGEVCKTLPWIPTQWLFRIQALLPSYQVMLNEGPNGPRTKYIHR
jgi:hypothetical protein